MTAPAATGPWWHAFGRVRDFAAPGEEPAEAWQLTVISPSTTPPDQVTDAIQATDAMAGSTYTESWGPYLTSWDHEPTEADKAALTPPQFRDDEDDPDQ